MTDPYTPPGATIADAAGPGGRLGWKIYLWSIVGLIGLSLMILPFFGFSWIQIADVFDIGFTFVGLTGLFGYAYRRSIFQAGFWRVWLPFQVAWDLLVAFVLTPAGLSQAIPDSDPTSLIENGLGIVFFVPLYFALYRYARRSDETQREPG